MPASRRTFLRTAGAGSLGYFALAHLNSATAQSSGPSATVEPAAAGVTVRYLGKQFLDNHVNVTGADGATSFVLPDGNALWVFGDTVEGPFESIHGLDLAPLRSNTAAVVPPQDASDGVRNFRFLATNDNKRPRQIIPFAEDEDPAKTRLWAIHGATIGSNVYLFYHRISLLAGVDVFENFRLEGMGVARADAAALDFTRLAFRDGSKELWKLDQPTFGVWVEKTDDYVYLWGSLMTGVFLARVPPKQIEQLDQYEYLTKAPTLKNPTSEVQWSRRFEPSAMLFDSVPNEMSAAYNPHLKRHLAIHALGRDGQIVMRTAPRRTGPWSEPQVIYDVKRRKPTDMVYAAKEHPELARDGGRRMYVTFVNSASYIPELIEVRLP
ncbi:MAG TPA: DUF4185 domain-containing protein [Lacipirellula sp.]